MAIMRWTPSGVLDVSTDPTELPQQSDGKNVVSGAMTRCTNLQLDRQGIAKTRNGYRQLNNSALTDPPLDIICQGDNRYGFGIETIYNRELSVATGISKGGRWGTVLYQPYNSTEEAVFASNGKARKRILNASSPAWSAIAAPTLAPIVTAGYDYAFTHSWEETEQLLVDTYHVHQFGTFFIDTVWLYDWEHTHLLSPSTTPSDDTTPNRPTWVFERSLDTTKTYGVVFTWARASGGASLESNPSPVATAVIMQSGLSVTIPNDCPDSTVTYCNIYRQKETRSDATSYYFEMALPIGTTKAVLLDRDEDLGAMAITSEFLIPGTGVYEWGISAPAAAPTVSKSYDYHYTYPWELTEQLVVDTYHASNAPLEYWSINVPTESIDFSLYGEEGQYMYDWEIAQLQGYTSIFPETYTTAVMYTFERTTDLSQKFGVVYTWCRKNGNVIECESNPSPAAYCQNEGGISVTIPASNTDPQVTHARVYRTLGDGAAYYYDTELAMGTTKCVLTKRDEQLGTEAPDDHDRPIASNILAGPAFTGYLFLASGNKLYFSKPQQPEYWPALYYIECGSEQFPIVALGVLGGLLYAATAVEIYMVQGTGHETFSALPMGAMTGTQSRLAFSCVHGAGVYHLGTDGVYLFRPGSDTRLTDQYFRPIMLGETVGSIPAMSTARLKNCWIYYFKGRLWFGYNTTEMTYPGNVLVLDVSKGRTVHYQYDIEIPAIATDHYGDRMLACDAAGYIIEPDYGETDILAAISWEVETKEFGELRKYFPRGARYDVTLHNGATANGYVLLDGTVQQTHPITVSRDTKRRLITGCNGDRLSIRISGTGPVSIYGTEAE